MHRGGRRRFEAEHHPAVDDVGRDGENLLARGRREADVRGLAAAAGCRDELDRLRSGTELRGIDGGRRAGAHLARPVSARGLAGGVALEVVAEQRRRAGIAGAAAGAGAARRSRAAAGAAPAAAGARRARRARACRRRPWRRRLRPRPRDRPFPPRPSFRRRPSSPRRPTFPPRPPRRRRSRRCRRRPRRWLRRCRRPCPAWASRSIPNRSRADSASAPVRKTTLSLIIGRC